MRGTTNKADYDEFVSAVVGFPPTERSGKTAQQVFEESYEALDQLARNTTPFPRAMGWKAYALALSVYEGWPLPSSAAERSMDNDARKTLALQLAGDAVKLDETDYDLHWALADVHLICGNFADAVQEFETALDLNRDERHPSLFAEAASAMMQAGDHAGAEAHFRKVQPPDWHHWSRGTFLLMKAGRAATDRETFLNLAHDELKATRRQLGDEFYQSEIQLILAAVHWRRWELYTEKAKNAPQNAVYLAIARRNMGAASRAIHTFQALFPYWSEDQAVTSLALQDPADKTWWEDAVRALWALP